MKRRITEKLLAPVIAAAASLAARYAVQKGPELIQHTVLPRLREATEGAGEKVPDLARSAVSSGGDLADRLTDRARDLTGGSDDGDGGGSGRSGRLSQEQLSERSNDRAKRRAQRRKATTKR
jgi:hypothetical protein